MTTDEIIKILKDDQDNVDFEWLKEEAQPMFDAYTEAIKAVEVVDKIKKAYSNCYKSYLNNLENDFSEETASFAFFQDVAFNINNILCDAYGSDIDCESWKMRLNKEDNPNV